jgi:hypothetical protein
MGARRIRREQVSADQKVSRRVNGTRKAKERDRRDKRMHEIIAKNKFPFVPSVMSWVSVQLGKPTSEIVAVDLQALAPKA